VELDAHPIIPIAIVREREGRQTKNRKRKEGKGMLTNVFQLLLISYFA